MKTEQKPASSETSQTPEARRAPRIIFDRVKHRQTSHWDDDYLSRDRQEALYIGHAERARRYKRRQFAWIGFWLALLCLHPTGIYWLGVLWTRLSG